MTNHNQADIDLVYLWVDGSDPIWRAKRNAFIGETENSSSVNCEGRYANNDELKYSMRSIEMYAPWIRKIFIVTDEQTPIWIDTSNPKVKIVDLKDILPAECLPCFNSSLIEKFYHRIPDLSEKFLYANDDMFINKNVTPNDFFTSEGLPIIRLTRKPFRRLRWFWREKIFFISFAHFFSCFLANARFFKTSRYTLFTIKKGFGTDPNPFFYLVNSMQTHSSEE